MPEDHTPSPLWEPYLRWGPRAPTRVGGDPPSEKPTTGVGANQSDAVSRVRSEPVGLADLSLEPADAVVEAVFRATHPRAHVVPRRGSDGYIQDSLFARPVAARNGVASGAVEVASVADLPFEVPLPPAEPALPLSVKDAWPDAQAPAPLEAWLAWLRQRTGVDYTHEVRDPARLCAHIRSRLNTPRIEWVRLRNGRVAVRVGKFTCEIPANTLREAS